MTAETVTYIMEITLSTQIGEVPSDEDVERLVSDQMSGELDEESGLAAVAVRLVGHADEQSA